MKNFAPAAMQWGLADRSKKEKPVIPAAYLQLKLRCG